MSPETKVNEAVSLYVRHPKSDWGVFCFNTSGDLFLNCDYGVYGYAWRSYGEHFQTFLQGVNADYVFSKFSSNHQYLNSKKLPAHVKEHVTNLIELFIKEIQPPSENSKDNGLAQP